MKKIKLFFITLLLTIFTGEVCGYDLNARFYFNNSNDWENVSIVYGDNSNSKAVTMFQISHTKLWCEWVNWSDYKDMYFIPAAWSGDEGKKPWDRINDAGYGTNNVHPANNTNYKDSKKFYFTTSSHQENLPKYSACLRIRLSEDGGLSYGEMVGNGITWIATFNFTGTYMSDDWTSAQSTISNLNQNSWENGGTKYEYSDIPVTGEVTFALQSTDAAYEFVGWSYNNETMPSNNIGTSTVTYNVNENTTYVAFFKRKQYAVTFGAKGTYGTSSVTATIGGEAITSGTLYNYGSNVTFTATPATGYKLDGTQAWFSDESCNTSLGNSTATTYTVASLTSAQTVYVKFAPKQCTVNLDFDAEDAGHGSHSGATASVTATYGSALPAIASANLPTSSDGYVFAGYFTAADGSGTQYYNADGTSARNWDADTETTQTLYAYYQKSVVTDLEFDPETAAASTDVTVIPRFAPTPSGTTTICYGLYADEGCTQAIDGITFSANAEAEANAVSFTTPEVPGVYYVQAVYRAGSGCSGTVLNTYVEQYVVASDHTVTVRHLCNGTEIAPRSSVTVPAAGTTAVTALSGDAVFGYDFDSWTLGDGVSSDDDSANPITISANYDGTLIAHYTKKNMIFFKDNLGWTDPDDADAHVYVNFLNDNWWDSKRGTGNNNLDSDRKSKAMNRVPGTTDVFFYAYSITPSKYISFTKDDRDQESFYDETSHPAEAVYVTNPYTASTESGTQNYGFDAATPMFVPLSKTDYAGQLWNESHSIYFNRGYWANFIGKETGYTLEIYKNDGSTLLQSKPFTSADKMMPMKATVDLEAGHTYKVRLRRGSSITYGNSGGTMQAGNCGTEIGWEFTPDVAQCAIQTAAAGDYTFLLTYSANESDRHALRIGVTYPSSAGDYRIVYNDRVAWSTATAHGAAWAHPSRVIAKRAHGVDTVSFFVSKAAGADATLTLQEISSVTPGTGAVSWSAGSDISSALSGISASGVYNFRVVQDAEGNATVTYIGEYTGDYYIRTDNAGTTGWSDYKSSDHKMSYSDFSESEANSSGDKYSHYYMHWCPRRSNVKFVIANDYSPCISDTLAQDQFPSVNAYDNITNDGELYYEQDNGNPIYDDNNTWQDKYSANIRFMWNSKTNKISRAYLSGSTETAKRFLVLQGEADKLLDGNGNALSVSGLENNSTILDDTENWIYDAVVKVVPGGRIQLYARYNGRDQYLIGESGETASKGVELIGNYGEDTTPYPIRVIYNFKTNRLIAAWEPAALSEDVTINADVMIIRDHQQAAQNIQLNTHTLTTAKTIYGVMRFSKFVLNNRDKDGNVLPVNQQLPQRQRNHYYISFPFDVNVSDIFGFGTYGTHWVIQYYDGKGRAKNGLWADPGMTYWKYVAPTGRLNKNEGYLLALSPSQMAYDKNGDGEVWVNGKTEVELYFPAAEANATISTDDVIVSGLSKADYKCTINRGNGPDGDRTIKDSYWRCIGVPSFTDYGTELYSDYTDNETNTPIAWSSANIESLTEDVPYLYEINWTDYTLHPVSSSTYPFKAMHAYMVQNASQIIWHNASVFHKNNIVRRQPAAEQEEHEFRLTLSQNGVHADQTFIRLTDNEAVSEGFEFGHDMSKEMYSTKANLYTFIGYETVAANSLPVSGQTRVVPVGLKLAEGGSYTFAMPDGTNGVSVILEDYNTNTRTNLALTDYTVELEAGEYSNRFVIEIAPVQQTATDIEKLADDGTQPADARKVMIDGILYIVKDGQVFDARGRRAL